MKLLAQLIKGKFKLTKSWTRRSDITQTYVSMAEILF